MSEKLVPVCIAICVALLAGCDRAKEPVAAPKTEVPSAASAVSQLPPQVPSKTAATSKDGQAPIQGQVDPKEPAQRQAFETKKP